MIYNNLVVFILKCPVYLSPGKSGGYIPWTTGDIPWTYCIKLDLCICTIPTVGFYGKHWEVSFSTLFPKSHHDPYEATAINIAASNLPLPAVSFRHPQSPLFACHHPPPQKGEFNSQCGDQSGSEIVIIFLGHSEIHRIRLR